MAKLIRTFSCMAFSGLILFALSLRGCGNSKQDAEKIDRLEKEKTTLESQLKELEHSNQQNIAAKDGEIAKLTELNNTLESKLKELEKQSSESNKKLSQDKAEKAIKGLASTYSFDFRGGGNGCSFRVQSIAHIELSQFTDGEATADVLLKCARGGLVMKFAFQKDIDNHWFLTKIAGTSSGYQVDHDAIAPFQNLKVPVR